MRAASDLFQIFIILSSIYYMIYYKEKLFYMRIKYLPCVIPLIYLLFLSCSGKEQSERTGNKPDRPVFSPGESFRAEVEENILPYWMFKTTDPVNGGFYGVVSRKGRVENDASRTLVINARILWTFSEAYRLFNKEKYLYTATRAYHYLLDHFKDNKKGGFFWKNSHTGEVTDSSKHIYAQAFCIYGLSSYYQASGKTEALDEAKDMFKQIEKHAYDIHQGGYTEGFSAQWEETGYLIVGGNNLGAEKSMNTHLHIMEAYTALYRIWKDERLKHRLQDLIRLFMQKIVNSENHHFHMYFNKDFRVVSNAISYGHDIEGSWLLAEAAEVLGDEELEVSINKLSIQMARVVLNDALNDNGSLIYEAHPNGKTITDVSWWAQAETVVGFYNAYQLTGEEVFKEAAIDAWQFAKQYLVDQQYGDWFKTVKQNGEPYMNQVKVGPWKGPYHNSRMCFEMIRRITGEYVYQPKKARK